MSCALHRIEDAAQAVQDKRAYPLRRNDQH